VRLHPARHVILFFWGRWRSLVAKGSISLFIHACNLFLLRRAHARVRVIVRGEIGRQARRNRKAKEWSEYEHASIGCCQQLPLDSAGDGGCQ
jgi:hypothetical protein